MFSGAKFKPTTRRYLRSIRAATPCYDQLNRVMKIMNMISQLRQRVSQEGKATISVEEFNQLQAEWICRASMTIATELKLFKTLADIQDMCIGEICMDYKMDAEYIGRLISEATGMTKPQLDEFLSAMKS